MCTKNGYDECYNIMAAKAHNEKRRLHCAKEMTLDFTMAKALQSMLDTNDHAYFNVNDDKGKRPAEYADCIENIYQANYPTTNEEVRDQNLATESWYSYHERYDFDTGAGNPRIASDYFTAMVWDIENGKFAFARRNNWVMAWYCPSDKTAKTGINRGDNATYKKAINKSTCEKKCVDNLVADNFSKCYQEDALKAHNEKRDFA